MFHVTNNGNGTANQTLQIIQINGDVTININPQPQQFPPTSSAPPAGSPPSSDWRGSYSDVMTGTRLPNFSFPPFPAASRTGFEIKSEPTEAQGSMSEQPAGTSDTELMSRRLNQKEVKVELVEPAPSATAQNVLEGAEQPQQVPPTSSAPPAGSPPSSDWRGSNSDVMTGTRLPNFLLPPFPAASRTGFEIKSEPTEAQGSMSKPPTGNSDNELMPRRLNQKEVKVEQVEPAPTATAQNVLEGAEIGEQGSKGIVNALKNEEGLACSSGIIDTSSPHSLPDTPSIPRQNRKRKAETDGDFCSPMDGSAHSRGVFINSKPPTYTFSFINVSLTDPQNVSILETEAKKLNVTVSNVITERMPVGQNRYIQHFEVKNRSEKRTMSKEFNKPDWKEKWALSAIIKDTATPFFAHYLRSEVPLRFIMHTTKCPKRDSYRSFCSKSQCKTYVKSCLADESLINEVKENLNEKGKTDFDEIIKKAIRDFANDAGTASRLAKCFLSSAP